MSAPDQDAILAESPIQQQGKRLGAGLADACAVADHRFFDKIAAWDVLIRCCAARWAIHARPPTP